MLRRLLLVGLMILAGDDMMQLIMGLVLSVAFLLFQERRSIKKGESLLRPQ